MLTKSYFERYPLDKLQQAMNEEMNTMREFDVVTEVDHARLSAAELQSSLDFRSAHRWKGNTIINRLCIRGYKQHVQDEDTVCASTQSHRSLKLMITLSAACKWSVHAYNITTAFLHAP